VTAQNTLTGKRYSTTTDITGAWSLTIPQNGRYVVRTQFAAFAASSQEGLTECGQPGPDADVFPAIAIACLGAAATTEQGKTQPRGPAMSSVAAAIRQLAGNGPQNLSLTSTLAPDTETQSGNAAGGSGSGAALPSIASNADFGGDSVAISGTSGQVSPLAGVNMDQIKGCD